jgi:hypothetical protein
MITVITWFALVCFTTTNASCVLFDSLPSEADCPTVLATVKKKIPGAQLRQCDSHRSLVVSQTGTLPAADYLLAK